MASGHNHSTVCLSMFLYPHHLYLVILTVYSSIERKKMSRIGNKNLILKLIKLDASH
jgi:hypothetical protein